MLAKIAPSEIININATEAGIVTRQFSVHEESAVVGVYVSAISGSVVVSIYSIVGGVKTLLQEDIYRNRMSIPILIDLPPAFGQYEIDVTHSGAVTMQVWARASSSTNSDLFTSSSMDRDREYRGIQSALDTSMMESVLLELRKMNGYLAMFAGQHLHEEDIPDDY